MKSQIVSNIKRGIKPKAFSVVAILVLALLFRTYDLLSLPIFTDEAGYLHWAKMICDQRTRAALLFPITDDGKQPLFIWLAAGAMQLFSDPLLAGRTVSAIAGVASCFGVYLIGRWLVEKRVGLLASTLYAVAPFTLLFDRMALVEGTLGATVIWGLALALLIVTQELKTHQFILSTIALGCALGAAIWTKMTALFALPFPLLCLICIGRSHNKYRSASGLIIAYCISGIFALLLAVMPDAENLILKSRSFSIPLSDLLSFPIDLWRSNALAYWSWLQTYLPTPLWLLLLFCIPLGLVIKPKESMLLLGCWASFALPSMLTAQLLYTTRYVVSSVVPLLLLLAITLVWLWNKTTIRLKQYLDGSGRARYWKPLLCSICLLFLVLQSITFDVRLITRPEVAGLCETDQFQYVEGWPSGYGFREAVELVKRRAAEHGGEVIVLSDHYHGLPYQGLALYLSGLPRIHHYVDGHIIWDAKGILAAWRSHHVPVLIVGNDGRNDLESFEREVPEAQQLGVFWKPGGRYSFRVYEIDFPKLYPNGTIH